MDTQNIVDLFILRLNTCHNMKLTSLIHCVIMRRKNQVEGLEKKYTLNSFRNTRRNDVIKIRESCLFIDDKYTIGLRKAFSDMEYQADFALVKLVFDRPCNTCIRGR